MIRLYSLVLPCLMVILSCATAAWLVSLLLRRVSIVDALWGPGFCVIVLYCAYRTGLLSEAADPAEILLAGSPRIWLASMTLIWGLRLGLHLSLRVYREAHEDRRYAAMRAKHDPGFWYKSLGIVFWLQGIIMWIVALPLQTALTQPGHVWPVSILWTAFGIWLVGFLFEAVGDWQLARFRRNPQNKGRVLNHGLWKYTRHPNYFGDFMVWWGLWLFSAGIGAPVWTVISPVIMSVFLMKFSGVGLLEQDITERRPEYAKYIRTTSTFFPSLPRETN